MKDNDKRDALVEHLRWLSQSCTTLSVAVQQGNPDVPLNDLSDMLDKIMPTFSDFMEDCFGDGEGD